MAATLSLHVAGLGTAIAIAARRGGWRMALGAAAGLALLARAHGAETLAEPWNPYLPIVWWVVFLLTLWSLLCDDLPLLPVAVVAGSFCVQSHISYLGQVAGLGAIVAATTAVSLWRRSHERGDEPSGERSARPPLRRALVWVGLSAVLFGVLWLPVAIEQLTAEPGNLAMLRESVADPAQPPTGLARGAEVWLTGLDLGRLVAGDRSVIGSPLPGLALLAMWALAAAAAMKRSHGPLVRLHAVVAGAVALGLVSASRISGQVIHYLVLWMWGTAIVTAVATLWTALVVTRRADGRRTSACGLATGLAAVMTVVAAGWLTVDGAGAEQPAPSASRIVGALADDTAEVLGSGAVAGGGRGGRYLVRWENVELPPGHANGLLLELERRGLRVGVEADSVLAGDHRVMAPGEATAVVTFVEGPASVARWRDDTAAVEVASAEPSEAAADEFARVRRDTAARLRVDGFHDVADQLGGRQHAGPVRRPRPPRLPAAAHRPHGRPRSAVRRLHLARRSLTGKPSATLGRRRRSTVPPYADVPADPEPWSAHAPASSRRRRRQPRPGPARRGDRAPPRSALRPPVRRCPPMCSSRSTSRARRSTRRSRSSTAPAHPSTWRRAATSSSCTATVRPPSASRWP